MGTRYPIDGSVSYTQSTLPVSVGRLARASIYSVEPHTINRNAELNLEKATRTISGLTSAVADVTPRNFL